MKKRELKKVIHSDLFRYGGQTSKKLVVKAFFKNIGFKYMYLFRKSQYHKNKKFHFLQYAFYRSLLKKYQFKYGYEIPTSVKIGQGIYINHIGGISINPKAIIGNNINITKGVTIGQTNRGSNKGVPTIGDEVWIGANAVVVGNIKIGNNVLIAPNAYVNFDVPNNSIVVGNPAKIIANESATEGYINNVV